MFSYWKFIKFIDNEINLNKCELIQIKSDSKKNQIKFRITFIK